MDINICNVLNDLFLPSMLFLIIFLFVFCFVLIKKNMIRDTETNEIIQSFPIYNQSLDDIKLYNDYISQLLINNKYDLVSKIQYSDACLIKLFIRNELNNIEGVYIVESSNVDENLLDNLGEYVCSAQKKYKNIMTTMNNIYDVVIVIGDLDLEIYNKFKSNTMDELGFGLIILNDKQIKLINTGFSRVNEYLQRIINLICSDIKVNK